MKRLSLRTRLALFGGIAIIFALSIAGVGLTLLFERQAYRMLSDDLDIYVRQIAGALEIDENGMASLPQPPQNARFEEPFSGLYWQMNGSEKTLRSRSLWDETLHLPEDALSDGQAHYHEIVGPRDRKILVAERRIASAKLSQNTSLRIIVGSDLTALRNARNAFVNDLILSLLFLAFVLCCATWLQLSLGLRPLKQLQRQIADILAGSRHRLSEESPREVQPLILEMNALLAAQEAEIQRSQGRAADLAHGLKTSLAALAADARQLENHGLTEISHSIDTLGETMQRHIERELARARIRGNIATHHRFDTKLLPVVEALMRTLQRTDKGEKITFINKVNPEAIAPFEPTDLMEWLGNLLDNAVRCALSRVRITSIGSGDDLLLRIEDDGPGIEATMEILVRQRGGRLDRSGGAGLGLAIVQDIFDVYGWEMEFSRSKLAGLQIDAKKLKNCAKNADARAVFDQSEPD